MNISVFLNGNKTIIEARPEESLMKVLRNLSYTSVKCGCSEGVCGSCTVLLNDKPVASCKIPVGIINNEDIETLDHFLATEEYTMIKQGFDLAGIKLCGYCNAGKIFCAYQILKKNKVPDRQEIIEQVKTLAPCCTDLSTLVNGIIYATEIRDKGYAAVARIAGRRK